MAGVETMNDATEPADPQYVTINGRTNHALQPADIITSDDVTELQKALAVAQGQIENAMRSAENPFFSSRYADLADIWNVIREPLTTNGLSIIQMPIGDHHKPTLATRLCHSSGQFIQSVFSMPSVKVDPQGVGSCITYMKRYALSAVCGVATSEGEDDGNEAVERLSKQQIDQLLIICEECEFPPDTLQRLATSVFRVASPEMIAASEYDYCEKRIKDKYNKEHDDA